MASSTQRVGASRPSPTSYGESTLPEKLPDGFASSNGRIEATEIDVATKLAGRILDELVDEGDFVTAGQVVAHMDTESLQAQRREAVAKLGMAKSAVETREARWRSARARRRQRSPWSHSARPNIDLATKNLARGQELVKTGAMSKEDVDTRRASLYSAKAAVDSAKANVAAADAAIATAKSLIIAAEANVASAQATIERIQADINDSTLKAPRDGRVQYRVAQPGEVLSAGGKVLNMVDLGDVYMTFFLPTDWAGRVKLGAEVRLVLDAAPQFVIPAKVTFVADVAQFTPKTVETAEERQKLTFRIKAHIDPELLKKYIRDVKTGLPGVAYVQLDPQAKWPAHLQVRLPEKMTAPGPRVTALGSGSAAGRTSRRQGGIAGLGCELDPRQRDHRCGELQMSMNPALAIVGRFDRAPVARLTDVSLRYGKTRALDAVSLDLPAGCMVGLIGPDGVGKSSLLALVAGARRIQQGQVEVLGGDMADAGFRRAACPRIAYMPQGLGKNLYPTLSVFENTDFFARLFGQGRAERKRRIAELLDSIGLGPFPDRPAGKLSGGMKQKLCLCCALIHDPDLLDPRRADHRRRSAVAPPVLGAGRPHPGQPAGHERPGGDRLHGGGRPVRLAGGDGRRPRARHRHAGGAAVAHRGPGPGLGLHRPACRRRSAAATRRW